MENSGNSSYTSVLFSAIIDFAVPEYQLIRDRITELFKYCNKTAIWVKDDKMGDEYGVSSWDERLYEKGFDMALKLTGLYYEDLKHTKFTTIFHTERIRLVTANPKIIPEPLSGKIFAFDYQVFVWFLCSYFLFSLLLTADKYIPLKSRYVTKVSSSKSVVRYVIETILYMLWKLFPNFFWQESVFQVYRLTTRFIYGLWLLSVLFLTTALMSNMQSDIPTEWDTIDDLEDVIAKPDLIPIFREESHYSAKFFKSGFIGEELGKRIYERAEISDSFVKPIDIISFEYGYSKESKFVKIFADPFEFGYAQDYLLPFFEISADFYYIGEKILYETLQAVPISSRVTNDCAEILNKGLYRILETEAFALKQRETKVKYLKLIWRPSHQSGDNIFTLKEARILFVAYAVGIALSIAAITFELAFAMC